jgi:CHAT domain-containing protein/Tfp pilus assembly protein PilF
VDSLISVAGMYFHEEKYDSCYTFFFQALNVSEQENYVDGIIESQIGIANCSNAQGNYQKTIIFANKGLELMNKGGLRNSAWLTTLYYLKGHAEYKLRKTEESISSIKAGIEKYKNNIELDSIYTLLYKALGNNYLLLGNLDEAKSSYELALRNELKSQDTNLLAASLIMNIGIIYSSKADYIKGEDYFEKSLKIKEKKSPEKTRNFTNNYLNLGWLQTIIGKIDEALINFNKAETNLINEYGANSENLIPIYLNKGALYTIKNEYEKAITYHEKALELAIRYNYNDNQLIGKIYGNLGAINKNLERYEAAIEWLKKAEQVKNTVEVRIRNLLATAICYQELGDLKTAKQYYELAMQIVLEPENKDLPGIKFCYRDYGNYNDQIGDFEKAEKYLFKAIELFRKDFGDNSVIYSGSLRDLGNHYYKKGDFRQALKYFQESLIINSEGFYNADVYSNPNKNKLTPGDYSKQTLYLKAQTLYSLYCEKSKDVRDLMASYETSKLAIDIFEDIRTGFTHEKSKLFLTKSSQGIFDLAIQISMKLAEKTNDGVYIREAFTFSEKGKSAVLLSSIKESKALTFGGIPTDILALESKLKNDIAIYTNLIYDENLKQDKNEENLSSWRDQLIAQNRVYDSLIALFESNYPEYFQLKYNNSSIDISMLQSNLSDAEILIEYDLLDSILVIFTISNQNIKYTKVEINEAIINDIRNYIEITHKYPLVDDANKRLHQFANNSNAIYNTLIKPVYAEIKGKKDIIIIPDDILGFISFESLVKELPQSEIKGYNKLDYLINDYCIRYSYSASLLSKADKKPGKTINMLAIAPDYSKDYILPSTEQSLGLSLGPLDYAKEEVENIQNYYPCKILKEEKATESNFKMLASEFDILHFSMHTIINNDEPLASKLVFSLNSDSIDDGFLNTYEIYNLPLSAELAVLSSCETGGGKLSKGEGILSLARGFIYSGVSSIVMTLWEIDDVSSADIISGFYERLKAGEKIDEALRNSKLFYLHSTDQLHAHPYFWSAYVQIGDNLPIVANSFPYRRILIVSGIIITLIIVLIFLKRKRKPGN